jgi:hypothetical protein
MGGPLRLLALEAVEFIKIGVIGSDPFKPTV